MRLKNVRTLKSNLAMVCLACTLLSFPFLLTCSDRQESGETKKDISASAGFTFFDLGKDTRFTDHVRNNLKATLGNDAIEERNIIDLELNYRGFLKQYFPSLYALNQNLNSPPGERVDHNTFKLMYRYARRENAPFDYVELVFSNYTKNPLLFKINFKKDDAGIVDALEKKYGPPEMIDWQQENGRSLYWTESADFLIVSLVPDQFGNPKYQIVIYFVDNLNRLIDTEKKEKEKKEQERLKSGRTAF